MSNSTRRRRGASDRAHVEFNLDGIVIQVVNGISPVGGGYSLAKVTGLSREDLIDLATALAQTIDETWLPSGGARRDVWVRTMLQRRLVDIVREESPVTRSVFLVLQKIWARQALLGGEQVPMHQVRDSLAADEQGAVKPERFDESLRAWELAMAVPISGFVARANERRSKGREESDPGFASANIDDEELIDRHCRAILRIVSAVRTPYPRICYGLFLYLFVGLTMKRVGMALSLSESRISQIMTALIPETVERAFGKELPGFDANVDIGKLTPEARKALRAFRKETRATWSFLPEEVQDAMLDRLFPAGELEEIPPEDEAPTTSSSATPFDPLGTTAAGSGNEVAIPVVNV